MSAHRPDGRAEAERDQMDSAFTPLLRALWAVDRAVLAVCFVDGEGECVDYCASLPAFDTKVIGAHMAVVIDETVRGNQRAGFGQPHHLHVTGDEREILARRVSDEYLLVVTVEAGGVTREVWRGMERTVDSLRREAGIDVPAWEPHENPLDVEVRGSVGWPYAPVAFSRRSERTEVTDVMGRWVDREEGWVCFRVRASDGRELTIAHDPDSDRWFELTDRSVRPGDVER